MPKKASNEINTVQKKSVYGVSGRAGD